MTLDQMFDQFWSAYPRHIAKKTARDKFKRIKDLPSVFHKILESLEKHKMKKQWNEGKEFIPHPATWIYQERWEDEIDGEIIPSKRSEAEIQESTCLIHISIGKEGKVVCELEKGYRCKHAFLSRCPKNEIAENNKITSSPKKEVDTTSTL